MATDNTKPESTEKTALRLKAMLREFTDGGLIIAFSVTGEAMITSYARDPKTIIALNSVLCSLMHSGGVQFVEDANGE